MGQWITIATLAECPPGTALERVAGDRIVALSNVDGVLHAIDGVCPHQGGPIGKGCLAGAIITCPWHGWQFDVRTGASLLRPSLKQASFTVRVQGDTIQVCIEDDPNSLDKAKL